MIRINETRRRGRPSGLAPLFVEDCVRCDATGLLAKTRGGQVVTDEQVGCWTATWTEFGVPRRRVLRLQITRTNQPFGGTRRWWVCPSCDRRCGVLLAATPESSIACRRCLGAQYAGDYPGRNRDRRLVALLRSVGSGGLDDVGERELDALLAKRRWGVRRGRRVTKRAIRLVLKMEAGLTDVGDLISTYR